MSHLKSPIHYSGSLLNISTDCKRDIGNEVNNMENTKEDGNILNSCES